MGVETVETLVVGGGQAGVAMSEHLGRNGIEHLVLERGRIAERWRSERWDSLVANGPAWHDRFPGLTFDAVDPDGFAGKEAVADYFVRYAQAIDAPIRCGVTATSVRRIDGRPGFRVETSDGPIEARYVEMCIRDRRRWGHDMTNALPRAGLLLPPMLAMGLVILAANILVQYPIQATVGSIDLAQWLTYGAISYPVAFLVTDATNRLFGPAAARRVVYVGFAVGVALSLAFAPTRIAIASGTAFLVAHMLDVFVFDRLRSLAWWKAPFVSSLFGSAVDTALFFSIAFAGTAVPWVSLGVGDFCVKLAMATLLLPAFRAVVALYPKRLRAVEAA